MICELYKARHKTLLCGGEFKISPYWLVPYGSVWPVYSSIVYMYNLHAHV